jgi:hypothetical protein
MASDWAPTPRTGLLVQACGDAHLSNFGGFAAPDRHLVFDVNDFDETLPGPWEWDVKRLAVSMEIAARDRGFHRKERTRVVRAAVGAYRMAMADFATMGNLDVFYARMDRDRVVAHWKQSAEIEEMDADALAIYGGLCGWTLAPAHARSGDSVAISGYLGKSDRFDRALASFAGAYADQNERDHRAFLDAIDAGKLPAERGI